MGRFDAFAVVFDDKGWPIFIGGDADASCGMARSVLDQITEDFRKVAPVERNAEVIGHKVLESDLRALGSA